MDLVERLKLLQRAEYDLSVRALLNLICAEDMIFWIEHFVFTFDPRVEYGQSAIKPFNLYPFQKETLPLWYEHVEKGEDFGVEKSRDMGLTWMVCALFVYCWLYRPGWDFLVGSRNLEYVDTLGNLKSIMPKMRLLIEKLPHWMKPEGYKRKIHSPRGRIINPVNGNVIGGESSNPSFGRGGRYKAMLYDELAFWPFADAAWGAGSQSSPCRIAASTPYGKSNKYGRLMLDQRNERYIPSA